ncbi:hypothetical protein ACMBCM_09450, partial [Spiroplasma sp. K1]
MLPIPFKDAKWSVVLRHLPTERERERERERETRERKSKQTMTCEKSHLKFWVESLRNYTSGASSAEC